MVLLKTQWLFVWFYLFCFSLLHNPYDKQWHHFMNTVIHKYSTNSLHCAITDSAQLLLSTWLNSWKFSNQPTMYALFLILSFFVFPLWYCTHLVRLWYYFLMLECLSGTDSFAKLGHQTHSHLTSLKSSLKSHLFKLPYCVCVCVCVCVCMCTCQLGYMLQF